jgi:hypothetical protein
MRMRIYLYSICKVRTGRTIRWELGILNGNGNGIDIHGIEYWKTCMRAIVHW